MLHCSSRGSRPDRATALILSFFARFAVGSNEPLGPLEARGRLLLLGPHNDAAERSRLGQGLTTRWASHRGRDFTLRYPHHHSWRSIEVDGECAGSFTPASCHGVAK